MKAAIALAVSALFVLTGTSLCVLINEVELNPPGDDRKASAAVEWVELYNPDYEDVDIGGWKVVTSEGRSAMVPRGMVIPSMGYYTVTKDTEWLEDLNETLSLVNGDGIEVDRTGMLSDSQDDEFCWTRVPDGRDTDSPIDWMFRVSSLGF